MAPGADKSRLFFDEGAFAADDTADNTEIHTTRHGSRLLTSTLASLTAARARAQQRRPGLRGIHTFGPTRTHPTGLLCETVPANNTAAPGIAPIRWPIRLGRSAAWHPRGGDRTGSRNCCKSSTCPNWSYPGRTCTRIPAQPSSAHWSNVLRAVARQQCQRRSGGGERSPRSWLRGGGQVHACRIRQESCVQTRPQAGAEASVDCTCIPGVICDSRAMRAERLVSTIGRRS